MSDEQRRISLAQRGDFPAFESLVREYEQVAFRAAFLITRDDQEAADAAQDAFLRAYRALQTFQLGKPFRPWLLRIVTNQALNRIKARERRENMTQRYARSMLAVEEDPSPDNAAAEHEQNERLAQAVHSLSQDEQTLVMLRYFLELPEDEVAEILAIPLGTVKSRLHRTLARLREIVRKEFPDLEPAISGQ